MIIYKDFITGDELFSDVYIMKNISDVAYEVEGKHIIEGSTKVTLGGANPSAEEASECYNDEGTSGIDIVLVHRLNEISIGKDVFKDLTKQYIKKIADTLSESKSDRLDVFKSNVPAVVKDLLKRYKDLRFFVGESGDMSGGIMILDYREDGSTPFFTFFIDGLEEVKC